MGSRFVPLGGLAQVRHEVNISYYVPMTFQENRAVSSRIVPTAGPPQFHLGLDFQLVLSLGFRQYTFARPNDL
ncbi:hypothetical protein EVAR_19111_1 [Eumeta japonica]|uniref:Uncharacterized protein n=1 Tax=Eumeta variegata TaxID=151549 RepID=A0A4C1UPW8_EUMVA|nr:hypothetical protein EVAR_19111_1 [Eumeta japonica]